MYLFRGVHSLCTVALNLPHQEGCSRSDPVDGAASGGEDGRIPLWCVDTYSKSLCFVLISLCLKRPLLGISSQFILFQTSCNLTMKTALTYDFHTDNHQHTPLLPPPHPLDSVLFRTTALPMKGPCFLLHH